MLRAELPMIRKASFRMLVLCTIFLKEATASGLCLAEIGEMMSREYSSHHEEPSELEILCLEAKQTIAESAVPTDVELTDESSLFDVDNENIDTGIFSEILENVPYKGPFHYACEFVNSSRGVVSELQYAGEAENELDDEIACEEDSGFDRDLNCDSTASKLLKSSKKMELENINGKARLAFLDDISDAQRRSAEELLPGTTGFVKLEDLSEKEWKLFLSRFQEVLGHTFVHRKSSSTVLKQKTRLGASCICLKMEKTIFCFCHWGGENVISPDGSVTYKGGVTHCINIRVGMTTFEEFVTAVYEKLGLDSRDKEIYFTVRFDYKQLILMKDEMDLQTLISLNDGFAHVYASNKENENVSSSHIHANMLLNDVVPASRAENFVNQTSFETLPPCDQMVSSGSSIWKDIIVGVGQVFEDANSFRAAIYKFSIAHRFTYKFTHNKAEYLKIKCAVDGCPWKISATRDGNTDHVSVRKFENTHTHSVEDLLKFKPKYNSKWMGDIFMDKIFSTPSYLPRQICKDSWNDYHFNMSYQQAWTAKEKAKLLLDGNIENSYKIIPWYCNRLKEVLPDTVATWSCYDDGTFKQLFVSYGCSIRGFHAGCRPLIFIDGCHLSGPYKGTLLSASSIDANNGMYPLAYGVVTSENDEDWLWFLKHLKEIVNDREVVIISDRNPAIVKGVDSLFGGVNHAHCYRHLQENFSSFINKNSHFRMASAAKERAHKLLDEIAYARTVSDYESALKKMLDFQPFLHNWVLKNEPEHWSNALFTKPRWDWLNSNIAESFNAWIGEARLLPIGKMMQAHASKYSQLLLNKVNDLQTWKHNIGRRIEDKLNERIKFGEGLQASSRPPLEVEVSERRKGTVVVNFGISSCTCLEWQMTGIPCRHACCAIEHQSFNVYDHVDGWYKKEMQEKIYGQLMHGIPTIDMPLLDALPIANEHEGCITGFSSNYGLLPPKTRRPPGRPRKKKN